MCGLEVCETCSYIHPLRADGGEEAKVCPICMRKSAELFLTPEMKAKLGKVIEGIKLEILQEKDMYSSTELRLYQLLSDQVQSATNLLRNAQAECKRLAEELEEERGLREEEAEAAEDMQGFVESIERRLRDMISQ